MSDDKTVYCLLLHQTVESARQRCISKTAHHSCHFVNPAEDSYSGSQMRCYMCGGSYETNSLGDYIQLITGHCGQTSATGKNRVNIALLKIMYPYLYASWSNN